MKHFSVLVVFCCSTAFAPAGFVISPLSQPPNNQFGSAFPFLVTQFSAPSVRSQQIYGSQDFLATGTGPFLITAMSFSQSGGSLPIDVTVPDVRIDFSTTTRPVDGLSNTFADNSGVDDRTVFTGPLHLVNDGSPHFGVTLTLQTPFVFDPNAGNLLMDVWNYQTIPTPSGGGYALDVQALTGDSVANVTALRTDALSGGLGSGGMITRFTVTTVPEPSTWVLLAIGLIVVPAVRKFRKSSPAKKGSL